MWPQVGSSYFEEVVMAADNENAEAVERALTRMDDLINQILTPCP